MKQIMGLCLALWLVLGVAFAGVCGAEGIDWDALVEGETASASVPQADATVETTEPAGEAPADGSSTIWADVVTKVIVWGLGLAGTALSALLGWLFRKYVMPWIGDTVMPWLEQKKLLKAAQTAVEYAEATIGRFNGAMKWELAEETLVKLGYDVRAPEVVAAAKAAWMQLDISQYAAGIKRVLEEGGKMDE